MDDNDLRNALQALPCERTMLLPALQMVQGKFGFLPEWAMEEVGKWLRVPKSEVYGAATSYASLRVHPPATHEIKVCCGASCWVNGSGRLLRKAEERLRIRRGERTPDGNLELDKVDCAFVCTQAPVVRVDGIVHGGMTEDELVRVIDALHK